jgi:hypothetical protein
VIVSGSDHGIVYVFDRRSGERLDELQVDAGDWVQTVLVRLTCHFRDTPVDVPLGNRYRRRAHDSSSKIKGCRWRQPDLHLEKVS